MPVTERPRDRSTRRTMPSAWSAQVYGNVQPMERRYYTASGDVKGRYWLVLLVGLCVLVAVGANVFP